MKMNGCNDNLRTEPQAKGRMNVGSFARNNLSKGGVNAKGDVKGNGVSSMGKATNGYAGKNG